ncbi:hypothetical protein B0H16DRAFT_1577905 [Mycena metata]|uniref:Uncharacterized protein n=1 Tax=Mycena metata TaxID=1033252 RepID=A0AAD7I3T2_9AGAR|nr:hypothetical protein B0H16DRAFT_1577905 [Mycena metata]
MPPTWHSCPPCSRPHALCTSEPVRAGPVRPNPSCVCRAKRSRGRAGTSGRRLHSRGARAAARWGVGRECRVGLAHLPFPVQPSPNDDTPLPAHRPPQARTWHIRSPIARTYSRPPCSRPHAVWTAGPVRAVGYESEGRGRMSSVDRVINFFRTLPVLLIVSSFRQDAVESYGKFGIIDRKDALVARPGFPCTGHGLQWLHNSNLVAVVLEPIE